MSLIVGFDYDSTSGVFGVAIDEDTAAWVGTFRADIGWVKGDSFARTRALRDRMPDRGSWRDNGVVAFGVEDLRSKQRSSVAALARVEGALLACLPLDIRIVHLSVNRLDVGWKAMTVGKTNASKDEIRAWALRQGAPTGLVQDLYDAFAIARATRETLENAAARAA